MLQQSDTSETVYSDHTILSSPSSTAGDLPSGGMTGTGSGTGGNNNTNSSLALALIKLMNSDYDLLPFLQKSTQASSRSDAIRSRLSTLIHRVIAAIGGVAGARSIGQGSLVRSDTGKMLYYDTLILYSIYYCYYYMCIILT